MTLASLPLPESELPEALRRFAGSSAPLPARSMAARGMVPVKGGDLLFVLAQLAHDPEESVATAARATLTGMPDAVLLPALAQVAEPSVLDFAAQLLSERREALECIVENRATPGASVARLARGADERLCELIAINQARILEHPAVLESLYKNRHCRMSTIDRLVEFVARNGVEVPGIPALKLHAEALEGQLIPEASDEPLPGDDIFREAMLADSSDGDVVERTTADDDAEPGSDGRSEKLRDKFKPLAFRIREMSTSEKIRFSIVGDAAARALLVRDPKKAVYLAAISSPAMTESEASSIAHSKEVPVEVLRYIGGRKEWLASYDIKRALLFNPKVPSDVSMRFLPHMRPNDLKTLSQSRGVPTQLKVLAKGRLDMMEKKGKA